MMGSEHTPKPLTYELRYSGEDWPIARVDFGTQLDGSDFFGWITTDRTKASECIAGEPEADLRLWSAAPDLLEACRFAAVHISNSIQYGNLENVDNWQNTLDVLDAAISKATEGE